MFALPGSIDYYASPDSLSSSSRWHKPSCTNPDIDVEDSIPFCKSCRSKPSLSDIISQHKSSSISTVRPPPDEPAHDMQLWWPGSVPYVNQAPSEDAGTPLAKRLRRSQDTADYEQVTTKSAIYLSALAPEGFRLLCITNSPDKNSPIHVTLETYSDDNHPEYETVSYTWGGEDGDSQLCRPIFVGPYWDVLLQTENCWQLLRFVRPTRGVRLIWIDAVCINQNDLKERTAQVTKMAQIYRQCARVILYLGPDTAPILDSRFPRRRAFHKINPETLDSILAQRYFTRIWVIQELILSPRAVIRIGQTDFHADSARQDDFSEWKKTAAPWLQYIALQRLQVADSYEALAIISRSQSADPRDRLFGILGLLPENEYSSQLRPDYSLSTQHLWIGFFAHCLLRESSPWFLFHATGVHHQGSIPSWVPQWDSMETWEYLPQPNPKLEYFAKLIEAHTKRRLDQFFAIVPDSRRSALDENSWKCRVSVCSHTGTLYNLLLEHLFILQSAPLRVHHDSGNGSGAYHIFRVDQSEGPSLYLVSKLPLDKLVLPMCDHLFLFQVRKGIVVPVVLRRSIYQDTDQCAMRLLSKGQYHLVAACLHVLFGPIFSSPRNFKGILPPKHDYLVEKPLGSLGEAKTLHSAIKSCQELLDSPISKDDLNAVFLKCVFLNEALKETFKSDEPISCRIIFPLIVTLIEVDLKEPLKLHFEESYLSCFDPRYEPKADDAYFQINIPPSMWWLVIRDIQDYKEWYKPRPIFVSTRWASYERRLDHDKWQHLGELHDGVPLETFKGPEPQAVSFRVSRKDICNILQSEPVFSSIQRILRLLQELSAIPENLALEELADIIRRPKEEFKSITMKDDEFGEFTVDGRSYYVDIV